MKNINIMFFILFTLNIHAGNIVWEKEFDSNATISNAVFFQVMSLYSDNSFYAAGYGIKLGSSYEYDSTHLVVTRFNEDGEIAWDKNIPSKRFDYFNLLDSNNSGGIEIISSFTKIWVYDNFGPFYPHIIRLDNSSNILYDICEEYTDSLFTNLSYLLIKKDNEIITYHQFFKKYYYYLIEKRFSLNGSLSSSRTIDSVEGFSISPRNIALDNNGSFIVEARFDSVYIHSKLYFFDSGLNLLRTSTIERNRPYYIQSMLINNDSEIILLGRYKMPPEDSLSFVWRLDKEGNFLEEQILPLTNMDQVGKIKQTRDKGYIILGRNFMSPYYCQYITKLDKNFRTKHQFAMKCDSSDYKFLNDFVEIDGGAIIVSGSLHSNPFLARIDGLPVSVESENEITDNISISPNPASDYIDIRLDDVILSEVKDLKIYNSLGECVINESIHPMTTSHRMNIEHLPLGLYLISINNGKELQTASFIILR